MSRKPKVSVIIVSWNAWRFLDECLRSLRECELSGDLEVIVVDNASSDGSPERVAERYPAVNLIRNPHNLGFAKANNVGIRHCNGDYIALVNSDVHVMDGCMSRLFEYLGDNPTVGLVGPFVIGGDGKQQMSWRRAPTLWSHFCRALGIDSVFSRSQVFAGYEHQQTERDHPSEVDVLSGCFWMTHRRAIESVGLLDEEFFIYGEDLDWCKRFRSAGWGVKFLPSAKVLHYGGGSSANAPVRFFVEKLKADIQYWRKHHGSISVRSYLLIIVLHHTLRVAGYSFKSFFSHNSDTRHKVERSLACLQWLVCLR